MVAKYDSGTLGVKLTDPGLVTLYNKLPLDHVVNRNRYPGSRLYFFLYDVAISFFAETM